MKGIKPSFRPLKKPAVNISKKSAFKTIRVLTAIAAVLNLLLLFGFNYGLEDMPFVSAGESASVQLSDTAPDSSSYSARLTSEESEVSTEAETSGESEASTEAETLTESETSAESEVSTEAETSGESEASTEAETLTESETSAESEASTETETSAESETRAETEADKPYAGPILRLTGDLPSIPASELKKLPVLLAKQGILTAEDGYGNDISDSVSIRYQMNYSSQGTLNAYCSLTNGKGDSTSLEFTFKPILTEPLILLSKNKVTLQKGDTFNYLDYISVAMDANGASLSKVIRLSGSVDTATPGTYEMLYRITGSSGQTSEAKLTVTVA